MGNVLLGFSHERMASQMAAVAGIPADRVWQILFASGLNLRFERGELTSEQFFAEFCEQAGKACDRAALEDAANDIFWVLPRMVSLVGHLRAAGHKLGILSNTNECHWRYVQERFSYLHTMFHVRLASFEARALKPEPLIYQEAARRAGVIPQQVFFADDRPENVAGAKAAGFDAVLFTKPAHLVGELIRRGLTGNY
jgi:putative hydrolase of the HAD superfamily